MSTAVSIVGSKSLERSSKLDHQTRRSRDPSTRSSKPFNLLGLPAELRLEIFKCFAPAATICAGFTGNKASCEYSALSHPIAEPTKRLSSAPYNARLKTPSEFMRMLLLCKQVSGELQHEIYKRTRFDMLLYHQDWTQQHHLPTLPMCIHLRHVHINVALQVSETDLGLRLINFVLAHRKLEDLYISVAWFEARRPAKAKAKAKQYRCEEIGKGLRKCSVGVPTWHVRDGRKWRSYRMDVKKMRELEMGQFLRIEHVEFRKD